MTPRRATALLLTTCMAVAIALDASSSRVRAHEEVPGVRAVLDSIQPPPPAGVTIQVRISAADQLVVENTTDKDLEVLGAGGELLFRIGRQGVFTNLRSPDWYRSANPGGFGEVPDEADPAAQPRLARVSSESSWGWFDHRLHQKTLTQEPSTGDKDVVVLETWEIPMRYDGEAISVRGHREFERPTGSFRFRLESVPEGLDATVLDGVVPALHVQAQDVDEDVVLLGGAGEPFARFTPAGVEVNEASPTWALTAAGKSGAAPPQGIGAAEPPRWKLESPKRELTWLEQRAVYEAGRVPPEALRATKPTDLLDWQVPVTVAGQPETIRGVTSWQPRGSASSASSEDGPEVGGSRRSRDERDLTMILAVAAAAAAGLAVALRWGRRARDQRRRAG